MNSLYYTPPLTEMFEELKQKAIILITQNATDLSYVQEKVNKIEGIPNVEDNFMFIVAMFDVQNQELLAKKLTTATRKAIRLRLRAAGNDELSVIF